MLNVGNLLNEEWGQVNQVPFNYTEDVVDADTVNGQYVYTFEDPSGPNVQPNLSRWAVQFGVHKRAGYQETGTRGNIHLASEVIVIASVMRVSSQVHTLVA